MEERLFCHFKLVALGIAHFGRPEVLHRTRPGQGARRLDDHEAEESVRTKQHGIFWGDLHCLFIELSSGVDLISEAVDWTGVRKEKKRTEQDSKKEGDISIK